MSHPPLTPRARPLREARRPGPRSIRATDRSEPELFLHWWWPAAVAGGALAVVLVITGVILLIRSLSERPPVPAATVPLSVPAQPAVAFLPPSTPQPVAPPVQPEPEPQPAPPAPAPVDTVASVAAAPVLHTPEPSAAPAVKVLEPVRPPAAPGCETYGTMIQFVNTLTGAARKAREEDKLLFLLHVSGNFEDVGFT